MFHVQYSTTALNKVRATRERSVGPSRGARGFSDGTSVHGPLDGITVLLLDDNALVLNAMTMYLTCRGARVAMALNAEEALDHLTRQRPDVIVADYAIPGTTGIEFLQQVRAWHGRADGDIPPAILFSALSGLGDTARAAGFQSYLVKPLDPEVLASEIARLAKK